MCARSSRRLSRAGRSCGSDAGGVRPPAGRPHGAEQRRRSLHPLPRPHSAVPAPGRRGPSSGGARRDAVRARAVDGGEAVRCFRRPGGLEGPPERWRRRLPRGGGAGPQAAEQRWSRRCGRLPRGLLQVTRAEPGERLQGRFRSLFSLRLLQADAAGMVTAITRLLRALAPAPASSVKTD